jgi:K+-transporting ATPase ATPase C chain
MLLKQFRIAVVTLGLFTFITGVLYPFFVTGLGQTLFPAKSNGCLILDGRTIVGSKLIGQAFRDPKYFWSRPSSTQPYPYNASASSGSNLGPSNPELFDIVKKRVIALKVADPENTSPVPVDLVTGSGSGLDPDISVEAARYQTHRVALSRGLPQGEVDSLVERNSEGRQFGFMGERRVNVLVLNLALDRLHNEKEKQ